MSGHAFHARCLRDTACVVCQCPLADSDDDDGDDEGEPAVAACGHVFHAACLGGWVHGGRPARGAPLAFRHLRCPLCAAAVGAAAAARCGAAGAYDADRALRREVVRLHRRAVMEETGARPEDLAGGGGDPARAACAARTWYQCEECAVVYDGGAAECAAAGGGGADAGAAPPRRCAECTVQGGMTSCPTHGTAGLRWKCQFCCAPHPVLWQCGQYNYCEPCHSGAAQTCAPCGTNGPCIFGGERRHPPECPPGVMQPAPFALGCSLCDARADAAVVDIVRDDMQHLHW